MQLHNKRSMRKLLFFVFLLFALINRGLAQTGYPIFVTPTLTPPYSLKLSEYSKFGSQRMVVNIAVNDLNISNLPVKLHIKLETVGVTIETPTTINTTPIYLDGGAVTILFGDDLADYFNINNLIFKGYSKETYRRTGQLPEGFYKMTVEVLHYQTNRLISNSGTATAWITLGKPPVLKLPENNKVMGEFKGMPLTFSWLPCNLGNPVSAGSVQYKFEMWEMRVEGVSPYVVASTVPVFYEETTRNTLLSVYPATMLMEPGMKYAWRITASDMLGNVPFEQDGHSEIRIFSYKSKCDSVTNFKADARGRSGLFGWQPRSNHTSYNVELRNPETGWFSASETFDNKVEFQDLEYGSTYEIRTQAVCDNDPSSLSDFTAWHRLEVPDQRTKPDSATCPNCGCDNNIIPKEIENLELNRNLKPGDTLVNRAGTTRFIVKTATQQGDGVYKGIFLFWAELWKVKFVCEYWDLSANTDNVILNMDFKSVYNPQFLLDVDVMTAYLDSLASAITTLTINTTISDTLTVNGSISTVYVNEGDSVIVVTVGENGELTEIVIGTDSDDLGHTLITGEDGEEYVVTGNGEVMGVDEFKNTGGNDRKIEEYKEEKESHLSATTVNFAASPTQKYGFDAYTEQKQALRNDYPALGNGYVPSYKSVASFATDKVVPSSFEKGITFRDEMGIPAVTTGGELTLRGRADGTVTSLYAYKAVTDTTEEVAGKLEVMCYDQQVKKLYIVPVNNAKLPDVTALQNVLNTVYSQAVTRWEVVPINESVPVTFPNGQMTHGGSSAIAVYNSDQNAIISKFKENNNLEGDALYLFFVDNVVGKTGDVAGYMPLQRQVGFIYDNPNLFVIAHELGHGAFNLRHTFSPENFIAAEHSTQNLMDYNGGTELWKHQWEFIRDPQSVWFAWAQDEKEGEMINTSLSTLADLGINESGEINFVRPDGKIITFDSQKLQGVSFGQAYVFVGTNQLGHNASRNSSGTLNAFKYNNEIYYSNTSDVLFDGFYPKDSRENGKLKTEKRFDKDGCDYLKNSTQKTVKVYIGIENQTCTLEIKSGLYSSSHITNPELCKKVTLQDEVLIKTIQYTSECLEWFDEAKLGEVAKKWWESAQKNSKYSENENICRRITRLLNDMEEATSSTDKDHFKTLFDIVAVNEILKTYKSYKPRIVDPNKDFVTSELNIYENSIRVYSEALKNIGGTIEKINDKSVLYDLLTTLPIDYYTRIPYKQRLNCIKELCKGNLTDYIIFGDQTELVVLNLLLKTPASDHKQLLADLINSANKVLTEDGKEKFPHLLAKLYNGIDGDNFVEFSGVLLKWLLEYYPKEEAFTSLDAKNEQKYLVLNPRTWTGDAVYEFFSDDGEVNLSVTEQSVLQTIPKIQIVKTEPYSYVYIKFINEYEYSENLKFGKGSVIAVPACYAYSLFNEKNNQRLFAGLKLAVDVGLCFIGVGEINAAIKTLSTARKIYLTTKATIDLALGVSDIVINDVLYDQFNSTDKGKEFLNSWNTFQLYYGIGSIAETGMEALIKKMYKNADELKKLSNLEPELKAKIDEITKKIEDESGIVRVLSKVEDDWLRKLDDLGLTSLKKEITLLDELDKVKFFDEFAVAGDDVLKTLNSDVDLIRLWKTYTNEFKKTRYVTETGVFKTCQSVLENHPDGYLGNLVKQVKDARIPSDAEQVVVGVTHPSFNGKVFMGRNFLKSESALETTFKTETAHPLIRERIKYMDFVRNSVTDNTGKVINEDLANKLLDIDNLNKLTTAGRAGFHGEVRALSDALYELEKTRTVTKETLSEFDLFIRNSSDKVMQRCPCCFYITLGVKVLEGK